MIDALESALRDCRRRIDIMVEDASFSYEYGSISGVHECYSTYIEGDTEGVIDLELEPDDFEGCTVGEVLDSMTVQGVVFGLKVVAVDIEAGKLRIEYTADIAAGYDHSREHASYDDYDRDYDY